MVAGLGGGNARAQEKQSVAVAMEIAQRTYPDMGSAGEELGGSWYACQLPVPKSVSGGRPVMPRSVASMLSCALCNAGTPVGG